MCVQAGRPAPKRGCGRGAGQPDGAGGNRPPEGKCARPPSRGRGRPGPRRTVSAAWACPPSGSRWASSPLRDGFHRCSDMQVSGTVIGQPASSGRALQAFQPAGPEPAAGPDCWQRAPADGLAPCLVCPALHRSSSPHLRPAARRPGCLPGPARRSRLSSVLPNWRMTPGHRTQKRFQRRRAVTWNGSTRSVARPEPVSAADVRARRASASPASGLRGPGPLRPDGRPTAASDPPDAPAQRSAGAPAAAPPCPPAARRRRPAPTGRCSAHGKHFRPQPPPPPVDSG